jgi:hypothetical protein
MTVPYWRGGERAETIAGYLRAIAAVVHGATGLEAYGPQVEVDVASGEWTPGKAAAVFSEVADSFKRRGIR